MTADEGDPRPESGEPRDGAERSEEDARPEASDANEARTDAEPQRPPIAAPAAAPTEGSAGDRPVAAVPAPTAPLPARGAVAGVATASSDRPARPNDAATARGERSSTPVANGAAAKPPASLPPQSAATAPTTSETASADTAADGPEPPAAPAPPKPPPTSSDEPLPRSDAAPEPARGAERPGGTPSAPAVVRAESVQAEIDATNAKPAAEAHAEARAGAARGAEAPPPVERPAQPALQPAIQTSGQRGEPTPLPTRAEVETPTPLLSRGLAALAAQKGGTMQIRLDPPSLGDVRIELTIRQGAVVAEITASSASTQALLARELGTLQGALERQGLFVERLAVHAPPQRAAESPAPPTPMAGDAGRGEGNGQRGGDGAQQRSGDGRHDAGDGASRGRREQDAGGESGHRRRMPRASFARIWADVEG